MNIKMIVSDLDGTLINSDVEGYKNEFRDVISEDDYFEIVKKDVSQGNAPKA